MAERVGVGVRSVVKAPCWHLSVFQLGHHVIWRKPCGVCTAVCIHRSVSCVHGKPTDSNECLLQPLGQLCENPQNWLSSGPPEMAAYTGIKRGLLSAPLEEREMGDGHPSGYSQRSMVYVRGPNSPTALNVHWRRQIIQLKQFHVLVKQSHLKSIWPFWLCLQFYPPLITKRPLRSFFSCNSHAIIRDRPHHFIDKTDLEEKIDRQNRTGRKHLKKM